MVEDLLSPVQLRLVPADLGGSGQRLPETFIFQSAVHLWCIFVNGYIRGYLRPPLVSSCAPPRVVVVRYEDLVFNLPEVLDWFTADGLDCSAFRGEFFWNSMSFNLAQARNWEGSFSLARAMLSPALMLKIRCAAAGYEGLCESLRYEL